jgi:hypothetical protein
VKKDSPDQLSFQRFFEYQCSDCGSDKGFCSRRRTFSERFLLPLFLLQPVRCGECFRRDYQLIFVPVQQRPQEMRKQAVSAISDQTTRNVA